MNAPVTPALLALPQEAHELMLRVAEATLIEASMAARGDTLSMRQRGHQCAAEAHESAAIHVSRIDIYKLVAEFVIQAPDVAEQAAFEAAAKGAHFNTMRQTNGEYLAITGRVHAVWLAAVRWARSSDKPP